VTLHCRYRSLLPVAHTAIDLLLVAAWIWHAVVVLNPEKSRWHPPGSALTAAYARNESIGWEPITLTDTLEPHFALLLTGTLPAGIISGSVRPEAGWQTRHRLWDPVWLAIHEAAAIPFWFLMGTWLDSGRSRLIRLMRGYLVGRIALALLAIAWAGNWWTVQFLFWLGLGAYSLLQGFHWLRRTAGALG
jgi:hypothetical protein